MNYFKKTVLYFYYHFYEIESAVYTFFLRKRLSAFVRKKKLSETNTMQKRNKKYEFHLVLPALSSDCFAISTRRPSKFALIFSSSPFFNISENFSRLRVSLFSISWVTSRHHFSTKSVFASPEDETSSLIFDLTSCWSVRCPNFFSVRMLSAF